MPKNLEKPTKMSKKPLKNIKIKRITGNKPSQISKNRQKCVKTWKKPSKISKNCQKCEKKEKRSQKYRKMVRKSKTLKETIENVEKP